MKLVVFLRDPLTAHPHDPDVQALMKVCDVQRGAARDERRDGAAVPGGACAGVYERCSEERAAHRVGERRSGR